MARPPAPSASGWFSGKALLPSRLVQHRQRQQLGESAQLVPGLGVVHALAGVEHGRLAASSASTAAVTAAASGALRCRVDGR